MRSALPRLGFALGRVVVSFVVAVVAAWSLVAIAPGGLGASAARAEGRLAADAQVKRELQDRIQSDVARARGVDGSLPAVVLGYLGGVARGDLGTSWRHEVPVGELVATAIVPTIVLLFLVLALGAGLGVWVGVRCAARPLPGANLVAGLSLAVPPVWLGILGLKMFSGDGVLPVLPRSGWGSATSLVLPALTLAPVVYAVTYKHCAEALHEFMQSPLATAARARGFSSEEVARRHGLKAVAAGLAPLFTTFVAYLLGATVITDRLFEVRGLGWLLVDAAQYGDVPVLVGCVGIVAVAVTAAALVADQGARVLDPRLAEDR